MKVKIIAVLIFISAIFSVVTIIGYYNEDTSGIQAARSETDEKLFHSELGTTRYEVYGERNTKTVILIHSFNGFLESWNPNIKALVDAGYRVVAYDLFGRGLSDRPRVDYDLDLFRNQLDGVVKAVGTESFILIGSSFGAVIASDYALQYPERVDGLVFVGPAGWPLGAARSQLIDLPVVADLIFHYFGQQILKRKVEAYLFSLSKHLDVVAEWTRFASYPGFTRSALSTLRHAPVFDYTSGWKQLGNLGKPTLFIWGKQDVSFPFSNTEKVPELIPHAKIVGIENAAHWVNVEQAALVNDIMTSFLNDHLSVFN